MDDCGCGGGKDKCITKHKKEFSKWVKAEMKRLDCGCGCKGKKKFEEKYGKLVGGALNSCPEGWRTDALTCVQNCEPGEKDDGLTCRKPCKEGYVDDGLTCRKPITSSIEPCPAGSKDIWGTCWGPVRRDCIDDCFKHPAPGCKTRKCGRLEWAGIDWGPKLCTECNLRCGQTCWDAWGITKQLHERNLKTYGGEVYGQSIYSKKITGRVNWEQTNQDTENAFKQVFGHDSALAKAFDPEKNGVAEAFRKFGANTKEAFEDIGRNIKENFEKAMTPEFKRWLESQGRMRKRSWDKFANFFGTDVKALLENPRTWIEIAIVMVEIAMYFAAAAVAAGTLGTGSGVSAALIMSATMVGPALRMINKAAHDEPIDGLDILDLVLSAIPPLGKGAVAATTTIGKMAQFAMKHRKSLQTLGQFIVAGVKMGQLMGYIPSTCIGSKEVCPDYNLDGNTDASPPPDVPPREPPPPGQKSDLEIINEGGGLIIFTRLINIGTSENPDFQPNPKYIGENIYNYVRRRRKELYPDYVPPTDPANPPPSVDPATDIPPIIENSGDYGAVDWGDDDEGDDDEGDDDEGAGRGGAGPEIEVVQEGNEFFNPLGTLVTTPSAIEGTEIPKGPGGCEFNVNCYMQNYPDLDGMYKGDKTKITEFWRDVGKKQNHNPCCGAKLEMGNYDEEHTKCNARNGSYNREQQKCDITRNTKGIRKTGPQIQADNCKSLNSFWDSAAHKCDSERNLEGKNKVEEAAKQDAEANKKIIDRIVKDDFYADCYAANNPDVVAKVGSTPAALEEHFRLYGIPEKRSSKCGATLQEQKEASNKAKAISEFNAYCYAYNNPAVFDEVSKPYFEAKKKGQQVYPNVLIEPLRQHFINEGYAKRLDYSCSKRDSEYNWKCFAEQIEATVGNQINIHNEATVNHYWERSGKNDWYMFNKGSCRQEDLALATGLRDFNAKCYAYNNPELILQFGTDDAKYRQHYIDIGLKAGLSADCSLRNEAFKPECYGLANPDLAATFGTDLGRLTNHWNTTGKNEWRQLACSEEDAKIINAKYYCQDTESFWDATTNICDLLRHTNGRPKEEISNEVLNNFYASYSTPELQAQARTYYTQIDADTLQNYNNQIEKERCNEKDDFWSTIVDPTHKIVGTCDSSKNPAGEDKKQLCAMENEFYDSVLRQCDPSRNPRGETSKEENERITKEEEDLILKEKNDAIQEENRLKSIKEVTRLREECLQKPDYKFSQIHSNPDLPSSWNCFKPVTETIIMGTPTSTTPKPFDYTQSRIDAEKKCDSDNNFWTGVGCRTDLDKAGNLKNNTPQHADEIIQKKNDQFNAETSKYINAVTNYEFLTRNIVNGKVVPGVMHYPIGAIVKKNKPTTIQIPPNVGGWWRWQFFQKISEQDGPVTDTQIWKLRPDIGATDLNDFLNLDKFKGSGSPKSLTLYWADWCPHCHEMMPEWNKLGSSHKGIKIEAIESKKTKFKVDGYPTIIFRNGNTIEKYEAPRTKSAMLKFLNKK